MLNLFRSNLYFLKQATALLRQIDDVIYATPVMSFHGSSIGGHIRHCLEHYQSFFEGLERDVINYDSRARDKKIETEITSAIEAVERLAVKLDEQGEIFHANTPIGVQMSCDCDAPDANAQASTVGRELQFLVSHTVHHFAMISGMCRELNIEVAPGFGVAPSTLQHRAAEARKA